MKLVICGLAVALGVLLGALAPTRIAAQREPLRVYDLGRVCLYALDSGGLWGIQKAELGVAGLGDACPRQRR